MKTAIADKKNKYVKVEQRNTSINNSEKQNILEEPEQEVEVIQLSPSFLNMPYFKFFIVKDNTKK